MGKEVNSQPIIIKKFLGLNNKYSDLSTDSREASALQNVNITERSVETRRGSTFKHATSFKDKTDTTVKNLTGLYQAKLNNTLYQIGIGGDAIKYYSASTWTDITGALTITDDDDIHWSFAKFKNNGASDDIIIAANGVDAPIKWLGSGNASALTGPPGNFNFPVVRKNKLWVAINDIVYFSAIRDGESWDTTYDLSRFEHNGEKITGMIEYGDRLVVFQESAIWTLYGSDNRDLYQDKTVTGDGTLSGHSIQEVESRRYGNILVFYSKDGRLKGFNGTKNIIDLGDPAQRLFDQMSASRRSKAVSANYKKRKQYWLFLSYSGKTQNEHVIIYDYENDYFAGEDGKPLSSILYHTNIKCNAATTWTENSDDVLVTGNYSGFVLKQDSGLLDEESTGINGLWQTKKLDFGSASNLKLITDLSIVTTQSTATNMSVNVTTDQNSGHGTTSIDAGGALWGYFNWGEADWSEPAVEYTRVELTNVDPDDESAIFGRYFIVQLNHNSSSESMVTNELVLGVTDLTWQPAYKEA